jgi:hypothetical protein
MRTLWDIASPDAANMPERMNTGAIRALIERALKSQGLRKDLDMKLIRRHEFKAIHGLRKFFQTHAERVMKSLDVMTLMGQDTGLAASYNKPTVEMLLTEYLKAVENLTINKEADSYQHEELIKNQQALALEIQAKGQEMQALRNQILETKAAQQKKDSEMQALKEQIEEIRHLYQDLMQRNTFAYNIVDGVVTESKNLLIKD